MQKQIYLHFAEAKYLRRSQNTKKPGQTQPESDFIQAKSKIVKGERKRELVPCFPRRILSKTMSKIGKEERNRAGLHAQIAEPHPIFCKDTDKRGQCQIYLNIAEREYLRRSQSTNKPRTRANFGCILPRRSIRTVGNRGIEKLIFSLRFLASA